MRLPPLYKLASPLWVSSMMPRVIHALSGNYLEFSPMFYNIHNIYIMYYYFRIIERTREFQKAQESSPELWRYSESFINLSLQVPSGV